MVWTIICFVIAAVVVALDQVSKILVVDWLRELPFMRYELIPKVLNFSYVENDSIALGIDLPRPLFMTVSTIAIIGLIVYMIGWAPKSAFVKVSIGMIIGGGIGNMIDRFFYVGFVGDTAGKYVVRDFIDVDIFGKLWPWVFNVADSFVCIGGAMLFAWCIWSIIKEYKEEKAKKLAEGVEAEAKVETDLEAEAEIKVEEEVETEAENNTTEE